MADDRGNNFLATFEKVLNISEAKFILQHTYLFAYFVFCLKFKSAPYQHFNSIVFDRDHALFLEVPLKKIAAISYPD